MLVPVVGPARALAAISECVCAPEHLPEVAILGYLVS